MRRILPLLVAPLVLAACVVAVAWSVPHASTGLDLYRFERESPTEVTTAGLRPGAGPLGLDLVLLDGDRWVPVHREGPPRAGWPRPEVLVGEHGARFADEPASQGAWGPFAVRAVGAWTLVAVALLGTSLWLRRTGPTALDGLAFTVFGQRHPDARTPTHVAGSGGHGSGGGQVPPLVPYAPDWQPDRRIR